MLLVKICSVLPVKTQYCFQISTRGQQKTPSEYQEHRSERGGGWESAQPYTVSQAVTLPVYLCHSKIVPIKQIDNSSEF